MDKDAINRQCKHEYHSGLDYKQGRVKSWQAVEDLYFGKVKKTLKGRFNVPMPVMSGFVDTLMSKIDDPPILRYKHANEADLRVTKKVQAFYDAKSKAEDSDFDSKDLDVKKLAIFSGRGIFKAFAESEPKFRFHLFPTDHYDFYVSPQGGGNLENARFCGEDNIFKSKSELLEGAKAGIYDKKNVTLLINGLAENTIKDVDNRYQNKANRLSALGLSSTMHNFMGEGMQRFIESGTIVNGVRYYVLWNYETGLAIRCQPLKEVFESNLWWWTSWATHRDAFNFWSKAPAEDIRPVAEVINILANQELDNRQKRNWGMRAYNPEMFPNGAELEYRPGGLVAIKSGLAVTTEISKGVYNFETPELQGTINLVNWLDNFIGQKSGVTAATQGQSEDQKVGIYQGNVQQVADRLGLLNKSYVKCHAAIGRRFIWGAYEHLNKAEAVKLIGENGVEWDELKGNEVNPEMDIMVESGAAEMQMNEMKKVKRTEALREIASDPKMATSVNQKWRIEQILLNGEYTDEEVRVALDTENEGNREVLARASEAIQQIIEGKQPKLFRGATTGFQQKVLDFATDNTDGDFELFQELVAYSDAHDKIVMENMSRKALKARAQQGMGLPPASGPNGEPPAQSPLAPGAPSPSLQGMMQNMEARMEPSPAMMA